MLMLLSLSILVSIKPFSCLQKTQSYSDFILMAVFLWSTSNNMLFCVLTVAINCMDLFLCFSVIFLSTIINVVLTFPGYDEDVSRQWLWCQGRLWCWLLQCKVYDDAIQQKVNISRNWRTFLDILNADQQLFDRTWEKLWTVTQKLCKNNSEACFVFTATLKRIFSILRRLCLYLFYFVFFNFRCFYFIFLLF